MTELIINPAAEKDIPVIHKLATEIWHAYYPDIISVEQISYMLEKMYSESSLIKQMKEGHRFYIAHREEQPIGYFSYSKSESNNFFLHKLYIKTSEHHKGQGTQLLKHLFDLLPKDHNLRLTVNRKNYKAINYYFKNGFVIEEVKDFDIGDGFFMKDFVMLRKASF